MRYWQSTLGEKAYADIGQKYPTHPFDSAYQAFHRRTRTSKENTFHITKLVRYQRAPESEEGPEEEFIIYDLDEEREDGLKNKKSFCRTNLGIYGVPEKITQMAFDEDGQPVQKVIGISNVYDAYEFKFTKEKADELHKWCTDRKTIKKNPTQYIVQREGGMKISVRSYKDWRDGTFDNLYASGRADGIIVDNNSTAVQQPKRTSKKQQQLDEAKASYATRFPNIDFDKRRNEIEKYEEEKTEQEETVSKS
jgi:hypothetical protein